MNFVFYERNESGTLTRLHTVVNLNADERRTGYPHREALAGWPETAVYWTRECGPAIGVAPVAGEGGMHHVTEIDFAFSTDSCGDDATAYAFAAWAETELQRRYPGARIAVRANAHTSGPNIIDVSCDDISAEADARDVVRELWDDFGRADWPGARVAAD